MNRRIHFAFFTVALMLMSPIAHAEEKEAARQEAQKLYQDAAKDMDQGQYRRACPKLDAAREIMPGHVRTAMTLAECYDKLGQPATALIVFEDARILASAEGKLDKVAEIDSKLATLASRVPRLTLAVSRNVAALSGFSIVRNGVPIPVTQWGEAVPVNPGTYHIKVTALDKAPWQTSAEIQIGQAVTIDITPPWSVPAGPPPKTVENDKSSDPRTNPAPPIVQRSSRLRTAGFVGIGIGVVGVGVGAILGGLAVSKNNDSDDGHCKPNNVCDQIGFDLRTEARTMGNASTALFIVGGLATAGGVILVTASPSPGKGQEAKARAGLWIGPSGVGIRGQW
ncbi:MAG: tetratricopeptide repeat protein [Polyangiaceae bacterium]|nr:tetratricopeptide repeat protein [Polyangiaceae bacterium]